MSGEFLTRLTVWIVLAGYAIFKMRKDEFWDEPG